MAGRVREMLGPLHGDGVRVSTFHGLCGRILRRDGARIGIRPDFAVAQAGEQQALLREATREVRGRSGPFSANAVLQRISKIKNGLESPDDPKQWGAGGQAAEAAAIAGRYQDKLAERNTLDFDDMMLWTIRLLHEHRDVAAAGEREHPHLLVDEYQDTNLPQYVLIRQLTAERGNVFAVGDPDQAIYEWRGASIENIMRFEDDFEGARRIDLNLTYRSTGNILEAARAVIEPNTARIDRAVETTREAGGPVRLHLAADPAGEARYAAEIARRRQAAGGGPVAVLYRTNAQACAMESAFRNASVPYRIAGGESFYKRPEVRDMLACVEIAAGGRGTGAAVRRFLAMPPGERVSAAGLDRIDRAGPPSASCRERVAAALGDGSLSPRDAAAAARRLEKVRTLEGWRGLGPADVIVRAQKLTGYRDALRKSDDKRQVERIENIDELVRDAREFAREGRGAAAAGREEQGQVSAGFVERCRQLRENAHGAREAGAGREPVTLSTLHAAKGLEFDTVILAGFDAERLPHHRTVSEAGDPAAAIEEERRLAYVGMTRARTELHLTAPQRIAHGAKLKRVARSPFIESIPDRLIERTEPRPPQAAPAAAAAAARERQRQLEPHAAGTPEPSCAATAR